MLSDEWVVALSSGVIGILLGGLVGRYQRRKRRADATPKPQLVSAIQPLENAEDGYLCVDSTSTITYANPASLNLLEKEVSEVMGIRIEQIFPKLESSDSDQIPSLRQGGVVSATVVSHLSDQSNKPALVHLQLVRIARPLRERSKLPFRGEVSLDHRQSVLEKLRDAAALASLRNAHIAVAIIDLDQFQRINESLGHSVGDQVLDVMAERLASHVTQPNILGRLGSDEFVVVLLDVPDEQSCIEKIRSIQQDLAAPIAAPNHPVVLTASIGVSLSRNQPQSADSLLQQADQAVHQAKRQGRNQLVWHHEGLSRPAETELRTEIALRDALQNHEIWLAYQPQIDLQSGNTMGCEALIRWNHPKLGQVSPDLFIPIAESAGLIDTLGKWVLNTACRDARQILDTTNTPFTIAVNVSAQQFLAGDIVTDVQSALADSGLPASSLELEITESLLIEDHDQAACALQSLREMGVTIAIDDFGTGYSSLAYLLRYPIDKLKIDRSFIEHLDSNASDATLTTAIITMAHQLGLSVVAEGVEKANQSTFLRSHGCDIAQGYLFGHAVTLSAFLEKLEKQSQRG